MAIVTVSGHQPIFADSITVYTPTPAAAVNEIVTVADSGGSLGGTYLHLYSDNNATIYTFWFDVDNSTKKPSFAGAGNTTMVEVDISENDTADAVATALRAAVDAQSDFTGGGATNTVTVTNAANGAATDPSDGIGSKPTGFTYTNTTKGITGIPAPGAGSVNFLHITGFIWDPTVVNQGTEVNSVPFAKIPVDIIVPAQKITGIIEN